MGLNILKEVIGNLMTYYIWRKYEIAIFNWNWDSAYLRFLILVYFLLSIDYILYILGIYYLLDI